MPEIDYIKERIEIIKFTLIPLFGLLLIIFWTINSDPAFFQNKNWDSKIAFISFTAMLVFLIYQGKKSWQKYADRLKDI